MLGHQLHRVIALDWQRLAIQQDLTPLARRLPTRQHPPQGGLAMAAGGCETEPLTGLDRQRQPLPEGAFPLMEAEIPYLEHQQTSGADKSELNPGSNCHRPPAAREKAKDCGSIIKKPPACNRVS
ncbi:hypothetical protein D3C71_1863160 [compost metagenome]